MTPIESIKFDHYLYGFSWDGPEAAELLSLTAEQRGSLSPHVQSLQEFRKARQEGGFDGTLAELVCLMATKHRMGGTNDRTGSGVTPFTLKELERADTWLNEAGRCLRAYCHLPPEEREWFSRQVTSAGADLPNAPEDEPLKFFAALAPVRDSYHSAKAPDALVEMYRQLSVEEGHRLATDVISFWKTEPELYRNTLTHGNTVEDIMMHLACFVPGALRGCHLDLMLGGMYYPADLFRDADGASRDHLLRMIEVTDSPYVIRALAWIGDEVVQAACHRLRQERPDFAAITKDAGWELTETGRRRDLYYQNCYCLLPVEKKLADSASKPIAVITPHEERCRWCRKRLVTLFDIDLTDSRLSFVAPGWERLRILMCRTCTGYGCIYSDVDPWGGSHWSPSNVRPGNLTAAEYRRMVSEAGYSYPQRRLVLGSRRRSPYEAQFGILHHGGSQVGGFPMWEVGENHPRCPKCDRFMVFIGQILTYEALGEPSEGVTYAFLCRDCRIAATTYEQT